MALLDFFVLLLIFALELLFLSYFSIRIEMSKKTNRRESLIEDRIICMYLSFFLIALIGTFYFLSDYFSHLIPLSILILGLTPIFYLSFDHNKHKTVMGISIVTIFCGAANAVIQSCFLQT